MICRYSNNLDSTWLGNMYASPNSPILSQIFWVRLTKHQIKVETALFYQACDQLGLLVIQDMPSLRPLQNRPDGSPYLPDAAQQAEFGRQLEVVVRQFKSFTCIATWVIYNEGWGQLNDGYPEFGLTEMVRRLDPTRLVDSTTGWHDHGAGDFSVCLSPFPLCRFSHAFCA